MRFNKKALKRKDNMETRKFEWKGPFAWPGYEKENGLNPIPDVGGVYLWTFEYGDGYLLYLAGMTKSTQKRFDDHSRSFRTGGDVYNLDPKKASEGVRVELWPWQFSKNKSDFEKNKHLYLEDVKNQLSAMRIFVAEIPDNSEQHLRKRIEGSLMRSLYGSKESWAKLADRGMKLLKPRPSDKGYYGQPIIAENICPVKIYGLPDKLRVD